MLNRVTLLGHLGADPEIRHTQDGRPIANLRLATSKSWTDRATGERRERTEWHRVVTFSEGLARVAEQYLRKGSRVFVEGELQTRKWTDQSSNERYSTEIVLQGFGATLKLLDRKGEGRGCEPGEDDAHEGGRYGANKPVGDHLDDEIPF